MSNAARFKQTNLPRQNGELARMKVVQGPDYGATYVIFASPTSFGRGEDNDVVISDLKASRRHALLVLGSDGVWLLKDNQSANGIFHQGRFVRQVTMNRGEVITLGETTLEFLTEEMGTRVLVAPVKTLPVLKDEQQALEAKRKEVRALGKFELGRPARPKPAVTGGSGAPPRQFILMILVAGLGAYLFLGGDGGSAPTPQTAPAKSKETQRDLAALLNPNEPPAIAKDAEKFFRSGFREFREKNYLRARTQFETVLQIIPGHPLASLYLENCNKEIETEVRFHLDRGKKSVEAGKLKEGKGHFEAVLRLLFKDPKNDAYIEAQDQLEKLKKAFSEGGYS